MMPKLKIHAFGPDFFLEAVDKKLPEEKFIDYHPQKNWDQGFEIDYEALFNLFFFYVGEDEFWKEGVRDVLTQLRGLESYVVSYIFSKSPVMEEGIQLIKAGAADYLCYPHDLALVREFIADRKKSGEKLAEETYSPTEENFGIIGKSPQILDTIRQIKRMAKFPDLNVLITGETGTGKELVARALHQATLDRSAPFVDINVAAIPDNLLESELFGYEKGAFTNAHTRKRGLFELSQNGTLLLDEIGDLDLHLQTKLLKAIENKLIRRVGGTEDIPVMARIITATNKNLKDAVEKGTFRQDLYYRLAVASIHLPPLRDRAHDIIILAKYFTSNFCHTHDIPLKDFDSEARHFMLTHSWPGNVRELKYTVERALITTDRSQIDVEALQSSIMFTHSLESQEGAVQNNGLVIRLPAEGASLSQIDRCAIQATLKLVKGNKRKAARILGISAPRLYRKLGYGS